MRFMCMYKLCGVVLGQNELLVDIYCIIIIEAIIHTVNQEPITRRSGQLLV